MHTIALTHSPYTIKPGNTVTIPVHNGQQTIHVRKVFEYDSTVHVTDETGYQWPLHPGDKVHIR